MDGRKHRTCVHDARVHFLWREQRVIVETDGWDGHSGRIAFEHDRDRDQRLLAAGHLVMRITWRQVARQPTRAAARLAVVLASRDAVGDRRQA